MKRAVPVRAGEEFDRHDGAGPDHLLGVDTRIRLEVIGRAHVGLGVWSGLDGQPDSQLADSAEPGRGLGGRSPRVVREVETWGMGRRERRASMARRASVPSGSAVFRYLERFHDAGEEAMSSQSIAPDVQRRPGVRTAVRLVDMDGLVDLQTRSTSSAADDLLGRGRPDRAFGVSGRQRPAGHQQLR